ncbi:MAG: DUF4105 domain-containing protein [Deltaproteobacteria bacterium]|nr:MAG: DUF4105 domain-containing protein [Deltaproteobacteria bacterium]
MLQRLPSAYKALGPIQIRIERRVPKCGARKRPVSLHSRRSRPGLTSIRLRPMTYFRCSINVASYSKLPASYQQAYLLGLQQNLLHELTHLLDERHRLSESAAWKRLSGWGLTFERMTFSRAENVNPKGFARKSGMKSPAEDFVTFAEAYFFPLKHKRAAHSIKCRMPFKFAFFAKLFRRYPVPLQSVRCPSFQSWVNPSKVHSLELLYVSPSAHHFSSISGHMLLRIKMKTSLKHLEDPNDLVIGFVANTNKKRGVRLALGGLTGQFLSVFEIRRLGAVISLYTHKENRDVWRFKIRLTRGEIRAVLRWFYRIKQSYQFHYYFLSKNCASVLVEQLRNALSVFRGRFVEESSFGKIASNFVVSPHILISKLVTQKHIEEVSPSFYSIVRRSQIATRYAQQAYARMKAVARRHALVKLPGWKALNHANDAIRLRAYKRFRSLLRQAKYRPLYPSVYRLAAFLSDVELHRFFESKAKYSSALQELRELVFQSSYRTTNKKRVRRKTISLSMEHQSMELAYRTKGSTYLGLSPITVSSGVVLPGWGEPTAGLLIHAAFYEQHLGDPSRFRLTAGTAITILSNSLLLNLNKINVTQWNNKFFQLKLFKSKRSISGERVRSVFRGLEGVGLGLSLVHLSGSRWFDETVRAKWGGAKALANLVSSDGHRSYLYFGLGLDVLTEWNLTDMSLSRTMLGLPVTLVGRIVFDEHYRTLLKGSVTYTPAFNTLGFFEQQIQGRLRFSQLLGAIEGSEIRLQVRLVYDVTTGGRNPWFGEGRTELFQATLGFHVRR